jgi:Carboxypeptidase regulatory-like domain
MMKRFISCLTALVCLAFASGLAMPLGAQTLGEITGVITDSSGAVIVGAKVTATNIGTNATRVATSNDAGVYSFPAMQPGAYTLKVEMAGFKSFTETGIQLQVQQTARIDVTMEVGEVTQTVEVSGGTALLTTENATVGTVIENKRIVDLPLNGRNFLQLVGASPNVSAGFQNAGQAGSRQGGTRSQQNISLAGQRSQFNRFTLDGVENTDVNFNTYIILPSIDALQEFKVQIGIFPAEFGRATSQINVSTKSGTNGLHGAVFEFLRNDVLDAKNYAVLPNQHAIPKEPFKWNQYGFTVGGPVWLPKLFDGRDKLFFMTNFEGYRDRKTLRGIYTVPTAEMRRGNFAGLPTIYDPLDPNRAAFQGNIIPLERFHPTSVDLLEFYPAPNVAGTVFNYQNQQKRVIDKDQFIQRIDVTESSNSQWFGRYSYGDETQIQPALWLNGSKLITTVHQGMLSNTRVLSVNKVNELRLGYNYFFNSLGRELAFERDVVTELGIPGVTPGPPIAWGIPSIGIAGYSGFGDDSEGPYVNKNHTYQLADNFAWTIGKHSIRFGGELRKDQYNQVGNQFARGSFGFEPTASASPTSGGGHAYADFLLGYCKRCEASISLAEIQFRAFSQYYYIDDTWKIRPNLTLNIGVRYENTPPWFDETGRLVNIHVPFADATPNVQDLSRHPTLIRIGSGDFYEGIPLRFNPAIKVARDGRLGDRLVRRDNNDWAPRLGIAYSPTSRWTIRAGGGIFYSQDTGNPRFDMARNFAGRRRDESTIQNPDLNWNAPFRNLGGTVQINNPYVLGNINERRTPYVMQYMMNAQRQLDNQTVLEVGYIGSQSRKLESLRAFNESIPGTVGSVLQRAPYPEFGRIQEVDGSGKASYSGLGVRLQKNFSSGLTYLVGYTWSRSIDNASSIRSHNGDTLFPQNSYNIAAEKALSTFHTAHRFVTTALYELPFGKGKPYLDTGGIANVLLGGWQLGSIITIQTGSPVTISTGQDRAQTGGGFDRPNTTGADAVLPKSERTTSRYFDTSAFVLQPLGTFGNVGRNTLIAPGILNWDFSTLKNFRIAEGHEIQFRFEAFNFANHAQWNAPNTNRSSGDFGRINSTRTMRELQFGLKYIF